MASGLFPDSRIISRQWDYDQKQTADLFAQYVGVPVRWLTEAKARNAQAYFEQFRHNFGTELNPVNVEAIERREFVRPRERNDWLKARLSAEGSVQVIFPRFQVCVVDASEYLARWESFWCRGAQAALHNLGREILLTAHEPCDPETIEFGFRKEW